MDLNPNVRAVAVLALLMALLASACTATVTNVRPVGSADSAIPNSANPDPPDRVASDDVASGDDRAALDGSGSSAATSAQFIAASTEWTDPGPGLPPSQRCGIEPPVTVGRLGLDLDIAVAAPAAYLDAAELTEVLPDSPATLEKGLLCLIVHDIDAGSVSCGLEPDGARFVPIRHEPLTITMVWFLSESTDRPGAQPPIKIYEKCDTDRNVDPLEVPAATAEPVTRRPMITADLLSSSFDTGARFYLAQDPTEPSYSDADCTAITIATERTDAVGDAVLAAYRIDSFWQPIPLGHVPNADQFAAIEEAIDATVGPNGQVINGPGDATSTLAQIQGLTNWMIGRIGTLAVEHEQRDDPRFADHIAWQMGGVAATGLDPFETTSMIRAIAANRCSDDQIEAAASSDSTCDALADAYQVRVRFREATAVEPDLRRELKSYLNPLDPHGYGDLNPILADPRIDSEAVSGFYYAERALASLIEEGYPMRPDEVGGYEERAEVLHAYTREHCPQVAGVDLPSVFELAPEPDPAELARVTATLCSTLGEFLDARQAFRTIVDNDEGPQPLTSDAVEHLSTMRALASTLDTLFDENRALLNPDGAVIGANFDDLYRTEQNVRLANFGPTVVPIGLSSWDRDEVDRERPFDAYATTTCPELDPSLFAIVTNAVDLPGPKYDELELFPEADELCPATERAVLARQGFREQLAAYLDGDELAGDDARMYSERLGELSGYGGLTDVASGVFPELTDYQPESFGYVDRLLAEMALDGEAPYSDTVFADEVARRSVLLPLLQSACPDLANDLVDTADQDLALMETLGGTRPVEAVPVDMTVASTCSYLEPLFATRVVFRDAIVAGDLDAADNERGDLYPSDLWDVETWPEDFDSNWIWSIDDVESELYTRAVYEIPMDRAALVRWGENLEVLIEWTRTNCPGVNAGLDLPPVDTVFSPPDPTRVAKTQSAYCAAAVVLYDARAGFRAAASADDENAALSHYRTLLQSQQEIAALSEDALHLNPDGINAYGSQGHDIVRLETWVRQAAFSDRPIPVPFQPNYVATNGVSSMVSQICDASTDLTDGPSLSLDDAVADLALPARTDPEELDATSSYCAQLETAQLALLHFYDSAVSAATDVPSARFDAAQYAERYADRRMYNAPEGVYTEQQSDGANRPENTRLVPFQYKVVEILERALQGEPMFDDRYDLIDELDEGWTFAPIVAETCPDLSSALLDLGLSDAVQIFDVLIAQS